MHKLRENGCKIHIKNDRIYVVTERTCKLYILKFENKELKVIDKVSILPQDVNREKDYTGCAIKISKDLKNIYVTVRGHNSITNFRLKDDRIKNIQNISCRGLEPRDLEIDSKGKYILVANLASNEITIFKRNRITGKLKYIDKEEANSPTCIIIE